jgi:hypothetical protein
MGEPEFRRGQRDCWPVSWAAFGVLALGLETLAMVLELAATATAASDCLWTAMLGRWSLQWASRVAMNLIRMTKMAARRGGRRVEVWPPSLVGRGRHIVRRYPLPRRNLWRFVAVFLFEFAWFCLNRGLTASGLLFSCSRISFVLLRNS